MRIKFDLLRPQGGKGATKLVERYRDVITQRLMGAGEQVAEEAAEIARERFANVTDYEGNHVPNDVLVYTKKVGRGFQVVASGQDVLFAEYGAGVYNPDDNYARQHGFERGQFGKGKGKQPFWSLPQGVDGIERKGSDGRVQEVSFGNIPARAMYHAEKHIRENAQRIMREKLANRADGN